MSEMSGTPSVYAQLCHLNQARDQWRTQQLPKLAGFWASTNLARVVGRGKTRKARSKPIMLLIGSLIVGYIIFLFFSFLLPGADTVTMNRIDISRPSYEIYAFPNELRHKKEPHEPRQILLSSYSSMGGGSVSPRGAGVRSEWKRSADTDLASGSWSIVVVL
ncbi:hypothetical protein F5Y19DRAFT_421987 [Xylariaceae sp. FL1651]|nr:hypothetical protein F5Y19DRAFT_421987 [Xylariaceae sp. FL1651]